jgi:hypothetical protein
MDALISRIENLESRIFAIIDELEFMSAEDPLKRLNLKLELNGKRSELLDLYNDFADKASLESYAS